MKNQQKGTSYTEYIIGLVVLISALMAPVLDGKSVVDKLSDAIKNEYAGYSYAISRPQLP